MERNDVIIERGTWATAINHLTGLDGKEIHGLLQLRLKVVASSIIPGPGVLLQGLNSAEDCSKTERARPCDDIFVSAACLLFFEYYLAQLKKLVILTDELDRLSYCCKQQAADVLPLAVDQAQIGPDSHAKAMELNQLVYRMLLWHLLESTFPLQNASKRNSVLEKLTETMITSNMTEIVNTGETPAARFFLHLLGDEPYKIMTRISETITDIFELSKIEPDSLKSVRTLTEVIRYQDIYQTATRSGTPFSRPYLKGWSWLTADYDNLLSVSQALRMQNEDAWVLTLLSKTLFMLLEPDWERTDTSLVRTISKLEELHAMRQIDIKLPSSTCEQEYHYPIWNHFSINFTGALEAWNTSCLGASQVLIKRSAEIKRAVQGILVKPLTRSSNNDPGPHVARIIFYLALCDADFRDRLWLPSNKRGGKTTSSY